MTDQEKYLFRVSNHHVEDCGTPPIIDADPSHIYHSYFENEEGEQAIFTYDRVTNQGQVVLGDAGWENIHSVEHGYAVGLVLGPAEKFWLVASWSAATRKNVMDVFKRSLVKEAEYVKKIEAEVNRSSEHHEA